MDLTASLKAGGRNTQGDGGLGSSRRRLRSALVVAEVALSLMLLIGAGLLVRSFMRLQQVSPGFDTSGVISMRLGATARQLPNRDAAVAYWGDLGSRLAQVPGVTSRGAVTVLPFTSAIGWGGVNVEGWVPEPGQELQVDQRNATIDYFRTMRVPLVQGRWFTADDMPMTAPPVVIVDEKFAKRFWPNGDAIGKHIWNDPARKAEIVGVVGTVKQYGLDIDGRIALYRPAPNGGYHVVRTAGDPLAVAPALLRTVREFDPTITVVDVQTMDARLDASMARPRFSTLLLGISALFAVVLAVVGVYGVLSHLVTQGAHDIGVRMALGAGRSTILRMVLRQGLELTAAGLVLGVIGALLLTRVMSSLLFNVSALDLTTFIAVPVVLLVTTMAATLVPAWRATRVDPIDALRES